VYILEAGLQITLIICKIWGKKSEKHGLTLTENCFAKDMHHIIFYAHVHALWRGIKDIAVDFAC